MADGKLLISKGKNRAIEKNGLKKDWNPMEQTRSQGDKIVNSRYEQIAAHVAPLLVAPFMACSFSWQIFHISGIFYLLQSPVDFQIHSIAS